MSTTKKKIAEEILAFKNTDFSDCPILNDDQMQQFKPSHYRPQNRANLTPIKKAVNVQLDKRVHRVTS